MSRRAPRALGGALDGLLARVAPRSTLADVQRIWAGAVGDVIAGHAEPVSERDGTLTVACESGVWAQEIELLGPELAGQLNAVLGRPAVAGLRCRATRP